jgi:hypothetical protein
MNKVNYDATLNDLVELWARKNIDIEIGIMNAERPTETNNERQIQLWSLQTPSKRKFGLYVIRATMDNCHITVSELVASGVAERQTILGYLKECEDAGWIKVCREEKQNKITSTALFTKAYLTYCTWLTDTYYTSELQEILGSIRLIARLKDVGSSVTSDDT